MRHLRGLHHNKCLLQKKRIQSCKEAITEKSIQPSFNATLWLLKPNMQWGKLFHCYGAVLLWLQDTSQWEIPGFIHKRKAACKQLNKVFILFVSPWGFLLCMRVHTHTPSAMHIHSVSSCLRWSHLAIHYAFLCIWNVMPLSQPPFLYLPVVCDACPLRPSALITLSCRVFIQTVRARRWHQPPRRKGDETSTLGSLEGNCGFHRNRCKSN